MERRIANQLASSIDARGNRPVEPQHKRVVIAQTPAGLYLPFREKLMQGITRCDEPEDLGGAKIRAGRPGNIPTAVV